MHKKISLRTPRLIIRDYTIEDFSGVHEYARDPETVSFMTWGPNSEEDTLNFIDLAISQQTINPRLNYHFAAVFPGTEQIIGGCGIHVRSPKKRTAEIGYCFNKTFWRQGYATEAAGELLRFGFDALVLHRIIATCDTQNIGSANVLERINMRREAHYVEHVWQHLRWRDSYLYAILEREWRVK